MKVTTKGQVTIPQEIREQLGIHPGSDVEFTVEGNAIRITASSRSSSFGKGLVERMRGRGTVRMSTDEIMALTRGQK